MKLWHKKVGIFKIFYN